MSDLQKPWMSNAFNIADLQKKVQTLQEQMERAFIEIERLTQESKDLRTDQK